MKAKRYFEAPTRDTAIRFCRIVTLPLLVAGCVIPRPVSPQNSSVTRIPAVELTRPVETPYAVRGYREATNASIRHEPHVIFRSTRVPINAAEELATAPRTTYAPATLSPLPINAELAAEIATQKKITEDIRALQSSLIDAESRMREQYGLLVRQSSETLKVRQNLEEERERVRLATSAAAPAAAEGAKPAKSTEAKW